MFFFFALLLSFLFSGAQSPFMASCTIIGISILWAIKVFSLGVDWFFYSLVIMFLGGMMIVFTYASSLSGIFKFYIPSFKNIALFVTMLILIFMFSFHTQQSASSCYSIWAAFSNEGIWMILISILLILASLFTVIKLIGTSDGPLKI